MKIVSLYDGMACGMLAMIGAGVEVESYDAYEIDKNAIQTAVHNFPQIVQHGDVFDADFSQYKDIDFVVGGSPCVPAGSKIKTDTGYKNIEDVVIGDMVLTHKNRYRPVIRLYQRQSDHLYHIRYDGDKILDITGNHPVYVYRSGSYDFIRVDELTTDDYITFNSPDMTVTDDKILFKIESIAKEDIDILVYNIEVEDDNSYTVNNCIVHNCTYWSIAQKNNRETEASGMGWELFSQYVRALHEIKPKYFIYENNKSMSKAIRDSITEAFGFEPICINSALVSAQNRQRLYWVGKLNKNGTYDKVDVQQPADRGILLKDILDNAVDLTSNDKSYALTASYDGAVAWNTIERHQRTMCAVPIRIPEYGNIDKSRPLNAHYANNAGTGEGSLQNRLFSDNNAKQQVDLIAMPLNTTNEGKSQTIKAQYQQTSVANICKYTSTYGASGVAEKVHDKPNQVGSLPRPNGELSTSQGFRIYDIDNKGVSLKGNAGGAGGKTGLYAIPIEFENGEPVKAVSQTDDKTYTVYTVANGKITIKGKEYPIKLQDGYYIIRKLSVNECKRLQTVPEWYEFPVSKSAAYKMLGNGWSVDVIVHLIKACLREAE